MNRKITKGLTWASMLLFIIACTKTPIDNKESIEKIETTTIKRTCGTMEVLAAQLKADPGLADRINAIERQTTDYVNKTMLNSKNGNSVLVDGIIEIPVVVHVIYHLNKENISDAQIASQIDALNIDYSATNTDLNSTPAPFKSLISDFEIHFKLVKVDRKYSPNALWGDDDSCKKPAAGGVAPYYPFNNLNFWVCKIGGGLLGYAQFPGGDPATDGVVISPEFFGTIGTVNDPLLDKNGKPFPSPYNKGRTATHEVGHWLNLHHIWGDKKCGNDLVSDTPVAEKANYDKPPYPTIGSCSGNPEMTMNYMDYVDDAVMYMFTNGQKVRTRAIFNTGAARSGFIPLHRLPALPTIQIPQFPKIPVGPINIGH